MPLSGKNTIIGVFEDRASAERALNGLQQAGFTEDQIGYAFRDAGTGGGGVLEPGDSKITEGAAVGALSGGAIGALAGAALVGLVPGIGPIIAGGALTAILAGGAAGAASTGLFGGVIGLGLSDANARFYEEQFRAGHPLVTVRADDREREARDILRDAGAIFADHGDAAPEVPDTQHVGDQETPLP